MPRNIGQSTLRVPSNPLVQRYADTLIFGNRAARDALCATPSDNFEVNLSTESCASSRGSLVCKVPLDESAGPEWPRGHWQEVDKAHERVTFKALAWLLERVKREDGWFGEWISIDLPNDHHGCPRCAPPSSETRRALAMAIEYP